MLEDHLGNSFRVRLKFGIGKPYHGPALSFEKIGAALIISLGLGVALTVQLYGEAFAAGGEVDDERANRYLSRKLQAFRAMGAEEAP